MTIVEHNRATMTKAEALVHVQAVNHAAADMGRHLLELKQREGWRALGYETWTAFLEGEFTYSRQHLYELMKATPVQERLSTTAYKISTKAAAALSRFDEDLQPTILKTAVARYGKLTESTVTRVGSVIQEMASTGHVDTGNGTSTPVDAALTSEDEEAVKRQKQYIAESISQREGRTIDLETGEVLDASRMKNKTNRAGDEYVPQGYDSCQTPPEALDPLLPYVPREWAIWEPAAGEGLLVDGLYDAGFAHVRASDILTGHNFFQFIPATWDCLITNPPYSIKYKWLERCYALRKPFALLLPVETLGAKTAQALFREHGVEIIFMDQRINFKMPYAGWQGGGAQFPTAWFTWGLDIGRELTFARMADYA